MEKYIKNLDQHVEMVSERKKGGKFMWRQQIGLIGLGNALRLHKPKRSLIEKGVNDLHK